MLTILQKKVSIVKTYNTLYKVVVDTTDEDILIEDINAYDALEDDTMLIYVQRYAYDDRYTVCCKDIDTGLYVTMKTIDKSAKVLKVEVTTDNKD